MNRQVLKLIQEFSEQYQAYQAHKLDWKKAGLIGLKLLAAISIFIVPFYIAPTPTLLIFSLPLIAKVVPYFTSPINKIIRPIANFSGLSSFGLTFLASVLSSAALYAIIATGMVSVFPIMMFYANIALSVYSLYLMYKFTVNLYKLNSAVGICNGVFTFISLPSLIPIGTDPLGIFADLLSTLTNVAFTYIGIKALENLNEFQEELLMALPLPEEGAVSDKLKEATFIGNKTALQSHRFFNTPPKAEFLEDKDRTFWQKASSFFGGGAKPARDLPKFNSEPLLLTYPAN